MVRSSISKDVGAPYPCLSSACFLGFNLHTGSCLRVERCLWQPVFFFQPHSSRAKRTSFPLLSSDQSQGSCLSAQVTCHPSLCLRSGGTVPSPTTLGIVLKLTAQQDHRVGSGHAKTPEDGRQETVLGKQNLVTRSPVLLPGVIS